jgi:hypothetical protein
MLLKDADAVPMFNSFVPSLPNCMEAGEPAAVVLIAASTVAIGWLAVPTVEPLRVTVKDVPLPVIM